MTNDKKGAWAVGVRTPISYTVSAASGFPVTREGVKQIFEAGTAGRNAIKGVFRGADGEKIISIIYQDRHEDGRFFEQYGVEQLTPNRKPEEDNPSLAQPKDFGVRNYSDPVERAVQRAMVR